MRATSDRQRFMAREWLVFAGCVIAALLAMIIVFNDVPRPEAAFAILTFGLYVPIQFVRLTWWAARTIRR